VTDERKPRLQDANGQWCQRVRIGQAQPDHSWCRDCYPDHDGSLARKAIKALEIAKRERDDEFTADAGNLDAIQKLLEAD